MFVLDLMFLSNMSLFNCFFFMSQILIGREYPDIVTDLIRQSKKYIKIVVYDWRWYPDQIGSKNQIFNYEIIRAKQRGVPVFVVINSRHLDRMLKEHDIEVKQLSTKRTIHVKLIIIDGEVVVIGSHNFTKNAFEINFEISAVIHDQEAVKKCEDFFNQLFV